MTVILFPSNSAGASDKDGEHFELIFHLRARVITADRARRKVNGWLCMEVGDRMLAGEPELLVGDRLIWRVPVQWTSPTTGMLAQSVTQVQVDATSGEFLTTPPTAEEIEQRVVPFAHSLRASTP